MALSLGQIVKGRKGSYRLVEALLLPTIYKAQTLPGSLLKADL